VLISFLDSAFAGKAGHELSLPFLRQVPPRVRARLTPHGTSGLGRLLAIQAVVVGAFGTVAIYALSALSRRETIPRGDELIYERMAEHPFAVHTYPFAYRIGLPWLVHLSPLSHTASFESLAWLSAGGAAGFAFVLMRRLGAPTGLAAGLAIALAVSPPMLVVALREGRNTDAVTTLFLMAAALFAVERRPTALAITLAAGVLFREAALFTIPFAYALWTPRPWDSATAKRVVLVGLPALAAFLALHLTIPTVGKSAVPGYGGSFVADRLSVVNNALQSFGTQIRRIFSIYGPLWIAAPLALSRSRFARSGMVLVACSLVSMTFALDWGRMIFLASPVFYGASACTLTAHRRWRVVTLLAFAALILSYAVYMDRTGVRTGIIDNPPPPYPVR
jgi:hypothetical protein